MNAKLAVLVSASMLALAQPVLAATQVKEVEVEIDMSSIKNPEAAKVWSNAAADLQNAIVARVADRSDKDGVRVNVDIDELALSNAYERALGVGETKLAGRVNVSSENDNTKFATYDLMVGFDKAYVPAGTDVAVLTMDSPAYYQAMVNMFADRVVEKLN
ncbi:hypothetical protein V8J36_01920 [Frigidibacter sp. MR17.14]|uniref:hypothetical protein n=1 Tax=Frigidibacter sp. MR17.14 TaxID=3126509 RepID=UPI003012C9A9